LIDKRTSLLQDYFRGDELIQHNPYMGDGVQEFFNVLLQWEKEGRPQVYNKVNRVLGEGNFVLVLSEGYLGGEHSAFYDLYRIEQDKIIEHWDVIEVIPEPKKRKNNNGKF
jgi:predicted SnoaL-like aldol condensation-catalyzing enzyme